MPDERTPPHEPSDPDISQTPNELNDSVGHLPYEPPTPAELHDIFESPEEQALQRHLAEQQEPAPDPLEPDPNVESVVPDLQPDVVTDLSEGGGPGGPPGEAPPPDPAADAPAAGAAPDSVLDDLSPAPQSAQERDVNDLETKVDRLEKDLSDARSTLKELQKGLHEAASTGTFPDSDAVAYNANDAREYEEHIAKLERELREAQQDLQIARSGVESVVGDLQPIVEIAGEVDQTPTDEPPAPHTPAKPTEISLETPPAESDLSWEIPGRPSWIRRFAPRGKPVYLWGVAVGVGAVGVAVAIALTTGGKSHPTAAASATTAPATVTTTAAAPAATTSAAAVAPTTTEAAPPATPSLSLGSIAAAYTHRPPPKTDNQSCDPNAKVCLGLPLKSVEVRYTTYTVQASDRAGRRLTYRWSDSNSCGTFKPKGKSAIWDFSNYQGSTCPKGSIPHGTVSVVVSDGKDTCTARYEAGGSPGRSSKPPACTSG